MNHDLTNGPIIRTMLRFALPMILGDLLQQCYNIADTLIVGNFVGTEALAASKASAGRSFQWRISSTSGWREPMARFIFFSATVSCPPCSG